MKEKRTMDVAIIEAFKTQLWEEEKSEITIAKYLHDVQYFFPFCERCR